MNDSTDAMQKLILANNNKTHACNNILVGQIFDITSQQFTTSEKTGNSMGHKIRCGTSLQYGHPHDYTTQPKISIVNSDC